MPYSKIEQGDKVWHEYRQPEGLMDMYYYLSLAVSEIEKAKIADKYELLDYTHALAILKKHLADGAHDHDECRVCDECGEIFNEGFCVDGGSAYYCKKECLNTVYTDEEWEAECEENEDSYWSQWG